MLRLGTGRHNDDRNVADFRVGTDQEPGRVYRIALVFPVGRDESASLAFIDELRLQGFIEGKNLVIVGGSATSNEQVATVVPAILQAAPDVNCDWR